MMRLVSVEEECCPKHLATPLESFVFPTSAAGMPRHKTAAAARMDGAEERAIG